MNKMVWSCYMAAPMLMQYVIRTLFFLGGKYRIWTLTRVTASIAMTFNIIHDKQMHDIICKKGEKDVIF